MTQFLFDIDLVKAEQDEQGLFLVGVASTSDKDLQNEILSADALKSMVDDNDDLPLTNSHKAEVSDIIGRVVEKHLDAQNRLVIKAQLDDEDPEAKRIFNKIAKGHKVGFSVGGRIVEATNGFAKGASRIVNRVKLDHIMVTRKPVNPNTFAVALHKALDEEVVAKADVSDDERQKYATYVENGEGKFPIFNQATAESALRLIGHAPADKQPLIRERACKILGESHPACASVHKSEQNSMENDNVEKAGAALSAASKGALMDIHDAGNGDVKAKVHAMIGDDASECPGCAPEVPQIADGDADDNKDDGYIGVIDKSVTEKVNLVKSELADLIRDELAKAMKSTEPKGEVEIEKSQSVDPIAAYLNTAIATYLGD